jgi:hypothetical protein
VRLYVFVRVLGADKLRLSGFLINSWAIPIFVCHSVFECVGGGGGERKRGGGGAALPSGSDLEWV